MEPHLLLAGLNILVVDDDEDSRFYITTVLEADGATVITVASAAVALKVLAELQPDVLICDISMPNEDGYTLIRKIRTAVRSMTLDSISSSAATSCKPLIKPDL